MAKDKKRILQTRAKKIARTAAKAAKRKKAASRFVSDFAARFGVTRATLSAAPLYRVLVGQTIFETGIGDVVVSRKLADGMIAASIVLLDPYCLGVKNAFLRVMTPAEFDTLLNDIEKTQTLNDVAPEYARKLVDGAITYARELGFEPHPDFKDASVSFEGIDSAACDTVFTYGKDGKPFYINGPNQSLQRAKGIIAHLTARLGPDGFHFLIGHGGE